MRHPVLYLTLSLLAFNCGRSDKSNQAASFSPDLADAEVISPLRCLAQADAERILGQSAVLTDQTDKDENSIKRHACTYAATTVDAKTSKTGNVYYVFEQYKSSEAAHKSYTDIVSSNTSMAGQELVAHLGDEAWFHTDKENFYLVMVRKSDKMVRIKVNKITSMTSKDQLMNIVREVVKEM